MLLIGYGCLFMGVFMFIYSGLIGTRADKSWLPYKPLDRNTIQKYKQISKIPKEKRTEEEKKFYFENQESYFSFLHL